MPVEQRDKCPVCSKTIQCNETVRVCSSFAVSAPVSRDLNFEVNCGSRRESDKDGAGVMASDRKRRAREDDVQQEQDIAVRRKMDEGFNDVDVRAIIYFMGYRARLFAVKGSLDQLLAQVQTMKFVHRERLVLFLANTPQSDQESEQRKVELALSAFNLGAGTNFTIQDLRNALVSADYWIKKQFAAIFEGNQKSEEDDSAIGALEKKLVNIGAQIKELKDRQTRKQAQESAQRLKVEIEQAAEKIKKNAEARVVGLRAKVADVVAKIHADLEDDVTKIRAKAREDIATLQGYGGMEE